MKTPERIIALANSTLDGFRGKDHQEFRAIVAANGYEMSRGGWVKNADGENVARGWDAFSYMVAQTGEVILSEPQAIAELEDVEEAEAEEMAGYAVTHPDAVGMLEGAAAEARAAEAERGNPFPYPTRGLLPEVDAILDRRAAEAAAHPESTVDFTYLYITRCATIPLSPLTLATVVVTEEATAYAEGECESGASMECSGHGFRRILPESMLPGSKAQQLIQCLSCYEWSSNRYAQKLHHYVVAE